MTVAAQSACARWVEKPGLVGVGAAGPLWCCARVAPRLGLAGLVRGGAWGRIVSPLLGRPNRRGPSMIHHGPRVSALWPLPAALCCWLVQYLRSVCGGAPPLTEFVGDRVQQKERLPARESCPPSSPPIALASLSPNPVSRSITAFFPMPPSPAGRLLLLAPPIHTRRAREPEQTRQTRRTTCASTASSALRLQQ